METLSLLVEIDGERFTIAGSDNWGVLNVMVTAVRANAALERAGDEIEVVVGGTCEQTVPGEHYHMRWSRRHLTVGSKLSITVLKCSDPDKPIKRYRSDSTVQESPFTDAEMKDMKYREYLALREEFEPDA
jgi:acyl-homoserine lactone acylase PvdQ